MSAGMGGFAVERIDDVAIVGPSALRRRELMNHDSGRIRYGRSGSGGVLFRMADVPAISGCEEPTVVRTDDGYTVLHTGVDADGADRQAGGHMRRATIRRVR